MRASTIASVHSVHTPVDDLDPKTQSTSATMTISFDKRHLLATSVRSTAPFIEPTTKHLLNSTASTLFTTEPSLNEDILHRIEQAAIARAGVCKRERNRVHQARYKRKQKIRVVNRESNVHHQLQEEIRNLTTQHRILSVVSTNENTSMWGVAMEYFRLFRNGYNDLDPACSTFGTLGSREPQVQRDFLLATMAEDVCGEADYGIEAMLRTWAYASLCYHDLDMKLTRLESDAADNLLVATMQCTMTITENTLGHAFSHLANGQESELLNKCLRRQLVIHGFTRFCWDDEKRRMISVHYQADMMTPLMNLLGNLEDVSCVFSEARITPECKFPSCKRDPLTALLGSVSTVLDFATQLNSGNL